MIRSGRGASYPLALLLLCATPGDGNATSAADARDVLPAPGTYELPTIARVPDFTLIDADGGPAPLLGLAPHQVAVVALIYTSCPSACPAALAILQQFDRELARDPSLAAHVRVVTVSFDPEFDTPEKMAALRDRMAPRSDWRFLTAESEAAIQPVLAAYGQDALRLASAGAEPARPASLMRHVLKVFLVDSFGDVRNIYSTGFLSSEMLLTDVRTLRFEDETTGSQARVSAESASRVGTGD
jgi:cytochrome oxidase Cu insertion factor (SCO1/SenC/PrrC family)